MATIERRAPASAEILSIDPSTGDVLARFQAHGERALEAALAEADAAQREWARRPISERSGPMAALAANLRDNRERYGGLITAEMGKPITEAIAEVEKCAWTCDYFAENAERFLADEPVESNATRSLVAYEPLGVLLAVMPWNFPFWQVFRFAAAAFMAGNGAILKHASNVPQCSLAIESAFAESGFPRGLLRAVLVSGENVAPLIADSRIKAVTLTGSSDTGSRVAAAAGTALKKTVLELGGSDPFIVLDDADLDQAVAVGVRARNQNTGQSCIAAKRFLVQDGIAPEFETRFAAAVAELRVGDPRDRGTQIGPLAREDLLDALERQVDESVRQGARVLTGGKRRAGRGFYFEPTVLAGCRDGMPVLVEETFGPVAAIRRVADTEEAIAVANSSSYGLGANLWTRDTAAAEALARRIESGSVFINGMVASDPRLPFGGVKRSGYGRELSAAGAREFTNVQTIWIGPAKAPQPKPAE